MALRIAHVTDPHLSFTGARALVERIDPSIESVILTGDIGEGTDFGEYLVQLAAWTSLPIYFVLGNHDYYRSSRAEAHRTASGVQGEHGRGTLTWLREAGVIDLGGDLALVGIDGLYDAGWGTPENGMYLNDFNLIGDLRGLHRTRIIEIVQGWGHEAAARGREALRAACATHHRVFFATHVPPFPEASRDKNGRLAGTASLPWYCARFMGEMLHEEANAHPDVEIVVLCGHTHTATDVQILPNLRVMVGGARYEWPAVSRTLDGWPGMHPQAPAFDPSKGVTP